MGKKVIYCNCIKNTDKNRDMSLQMLKNNNCWWGIDTHNHDKQMTKDTTDTLKLYESSEHTRPCPTKYQKNLNKRWTKHRPEH